MACFENNMGVLVLGIPAFQILCPSPYSKITHKTITEVSIVYSIKAEKTNFKIPPEQAPQKNAKKRIIFHP